MLQFRTFNLVLVSSIFVAAVLGCGGGGSSSGGGIDYSGTYVGPATFNISAGGMTQSVTGLQQIVIAPDNTVAIGDPGQPPVGSGTLSGNTATVSVPGSFANQPGLSCTGTIVGTGTINGTTITGTFMSSNFVCNGVPFTITGNFSAEKVPPAAKAPIGPGAMESLRSGISLGV